MITICFKKLDILVTFLISPLKKIGTFFHSVHEFRENSENFCRKKYSFFFRNLQNCHTILKSFQLASNRFVIVRLKIIYEYQWILLFKLPNDKVLEYLCYTLTLNLVICLFILLCINEKILTTNKRPKTLSYNKVYNCTVSLLFNPNDKKFKTYALC